MQTRTTTILFGGCAARTYNSARLVANTVSFMSRCHFAMRRNGSLLAEQSSFLPMPQLSIQDANLYLFFLTSSAVVFTEKVNDAWYRANRTGGQIYEETLVGGQGNVTTYRQDKPGSPMACMERHQYCFPGVGDEDRRCTPLTSSADLTDPTIYLEDDAKRQEMRWMLNTSVDRMILTMHPISMLGIQVLTSRSSRDGGFQAPLPDNQWQLDVQHWHFTTMAALQARFVSYVLGPSDPRLGPVWRLAETKAEKELCRSQVRAGTTLNHRGMVTSLTYHKPAEDSNAGLHLLQHSWLICHNWSRWHHPGPVILSAADRVPPAAARLHFNICAARVGCQRAISAAEAGSRRSRRRPLVVCLPVRPHHQVGTSLGRAGPHRSEPSAVGWNFSGPGRRQ